MRKYLRLTIGAALLAAAQIATAGIARIEVSNLTMSVSGGEGWIWTPRNVDWVSPTAETLANLDNPTLTQGATGWHGDAQGAQVIDGSSIAMAGMTQATGWELNGVTGFAEVEANDGQSGWAFAKLFDGQILVGGGATLTITATLEDLFATGDSAQANAFIEFCSTDFVTDTCDFANYAEAFVDSTSGPYSGPNVITASWTNTGATAWAKLRFGLTASAATDVQVVPEPASITMLLTGLGLLGLSRRRHQRLTAAS